MEWNGKGVVEKGSYGNTWEFCARCSPIDTNLTRDILDLWKPVVKNSWGFDFDRYPIVGSRKV